MTRSARQERGFTLVELTVALMAGLIVAMGIVGLSRSATTTFHEEIRNAAAEGSLRTAVDRLRADLARAGYMSTGNIQTDPSYPILRGSATDTTNNLSNISVNMGGILALASIHLVDGGSVTLNKLPLSGSQPTPLAPDYIEIGGNMTTADEFEVDKILAPNGNCQRIQLVSNSAAMYRLNVVGVGTAAAASELRNVFQPVPAGQATQFIVRITDPSNHSQYVATCPEAVTAGFDGSTPYVDIDATNTKYQPPSATNLGSNSGYCSRCQINPVQIVRWEITGAAGATDTEPQQYVNALDNQPLQPGTADPAKYDLMRSFVDATGALVPTTSEIVAEYAVDLDFAFTVDEGLSNQNPSLYTYGFDNAAGNDLWARDVSKTPAPNHGPERIRAVRARLVTRTAQPDRSANVPFASNNLNEEFLYRYCVLAPCPSPPDRTLRWARARTITTEVRLSNQARNYY
jgi:prepilin-type N-terminal cleavage/methylation domain-containing protein